MFKGFAQIDYFTTDQSKAAIQSRNVQPKAWPWGIRASPVKQDKVFQVRQGEAEHQGKQAPRLGLGVVPICLDKSGFFPTLPFVTRCFSLGWAHFGHKATIPFLSSDFSVITQENYDLAKTSIKSVQIATKTRKSALNYLSIKKFALCT